MSKMHPLAKLREEAHQATIEKVRAAMVKIEEAVTKGDAGILSGEGSKVNLTTVCQVAGIGRSTLDAAQNRPLREEVRAWLLKLKRARPIIKRDAIEQQRQTITEMSLAMASLAADVTVYRLRAEEAEKLIVALRSEITDLKEGKPGKIIPFGDLK